MHSAFFTSALALLSSTTVYGTPQVRNHSDVARRAEGASTFSNVRFTYYKVGFDSCGTNQLDSDFVVAMDPDLYGNGSGCCGRKLRLSYQGKTAIATCVDKCTAGCSFGELDLSTGLFSIFQPLSVGSFFGSWSYVN
ncbi:hypothetical protein C8J56DRAFT_1081744 [Mycena floridula]|nr:hypothetical protein C8J56DRAFT_1081744 [Mycena floridula]